MRTIPQSIKNALKDRSLPLKKQILMYRRAWNSTTSAYELESSPVDVTHLLQESSSIKMALDTDEVDKWDASNVTLTFKNTLNCFKEGLPNGLFESAVLWGSKFVYLVKNADKNAPNDSVAVFTGYVYSSPVFKDNGNFISLTITSSLDALEYVSAEDYCLSKTDELATVVTSQNQSDQGKEFATVETSIGYIDCVKYGATLAESVELKAGEEYEVSALNEYANPAQVKLKFAPTAGHSMWLSYRYWHRDMKIEDIVNALLDLAGVTERQIMPAAFSTDAQAVTKLSKENSVAFLMQFNEVEDNIQLYPQLLGGVSYQGKWNATQDVLNREFAYELMWQAHANLPSKGLFADSYFLLSQTSDTSHWNLGNGAYMAFLDDNGNGIEFYRRGTGRQSLLKVTNYAYKHFEAIELYAVENNYLVAFDIDENGNMGAWIWNGSAYERRAAGNYGGSFKVTQIRKIMYSESLEGFAYTPEVWYSHEIPAGPFRVSAILQNEKVFQQPSLFLTAQALDGFKKWGKVSALLTNEKGGSGQFYWADSDDGITFSSLTPILVGDEIPSTKPYLRVYYKMISPYDARQLVTGLQVSQHLGSIVVPVVNCTGLTVGEAIAQLAKMTGYEIGFNQDGVFFFRARTGTYTEVELTPSELLSCENHAADVDHLINRVSVEFGNFKTTIDDRTENKPRPHSIDTYGVYEKSISSDNFIPADNVDISSAVARANYEALSTPGYTVRIECLPKLELELGDKIRVSSKNAQLADPNWTDHTKFEQLPIWKRVFKIIGIELSVDKRKMVLNLKDVTTNADEPEETMYEFVYDFPINLGAKK